MDIRSTMRPGDLGEIVRLHGTIYAQEHGFDETFEAYVAGPLAEFVMRRGKRERIWIVDDAGAIAGCVAIVQKYQTEAQLRWFLVDPGRRGSGLGSTLLEMAVNFCKVCKYRGVMLWTVNLLTDAARLYEKQGFRRVETLRGRCWGVDLVEEKYMLDLVAPPAKPRCHPPC